MCKLWENYRERSKKSQIFEIDLRIFLFTIFPEVVGTYLRREISAEHQWIQTAPIDVVWCGARSEFKKLRETERSTNSDGSGSG